jgi:hypothetical protein
MTCMHAGVIPVPELLTSRPPVSESSGGWDRRGIAPRSPTGYSLRSRPATSTPSHRSGQTTSRSGTSATISVLSGLRAAKAGPCRDMPRSAPRGTGLAMAVATRGELAGEVIPHADRGCQIGRRNTSRLWRCPMGRPAGWMMTVTGRPAMRSPGCPPIRDRVTVDSVRNHAARHFPVQQAARATYREILMPSADCPA